MRGGAGAQEGDGAAKGAREATRRRGGEGGRGSAGAEGGEDGGAHGRKEEKATGGEGAHERGDKE